MLAAACSPQTPMDASVEGCYPWCANNYSALCNRCKCRGCARCRPEVVRTASSLTVGHQSYPRSHTAWTASPSRVAAFARRPPPPPPLPSRLSSPPPPPQTTHNLLVALRGEAFREGDQHSRQTMVSREPEWRALHSVRTHVLEPAVRQGWTTIVIADVAAPAKYAEMFRRRMQTDLQAVRARPLARVQPRPVPLHTSRRVTRPLRAKVRRSPTWTERLGLSSRVWEPLWVRRTAPDSTKVAARARVLAKRARQSQTSTRQA